MEYTVLHAGFLDGLFTGLGWVIGNWDKIIAIPAAVVAVVIAVAVFIPGEEPERTLRKIAGLLQKISRK